MISKFAVKKFARIAVAGVFGLSTFALAQADPGCFLHRTLPLLPRPRPRQYQKLLGPRSEPSTSNRQSLPLTKGGAISTCSPRNLNPSRMS